MFFRHFWCCINLRPLSCGTLMHQLRPSGTSGKSFILGSVESVWAILEGVCICVCACGSYNLSTEPLSSQVLFLICKKLIGHQMINSTEILKWLREILICRNKFLLKNKVSALNIYFHQPPSSSAANSIVSTPLLTRRGHWCSNYCHAIFTFCVFCQKLHSNTL